MWKNKKRGCLTLWYNVLHWKWKHRSIWWKEKSGILPSVDCSEFRTITIFITLSLSSKVCKMFCFFIGGQIRDNQSFWGFTELIEGQSWGAGPFRMPVFEGVVWGTNLRGEFEGLEVNGEYEVNDWYSAVFCKMTITKYEVEIAYPITE